MWPATEWRATLAASDSRPSAVALEARTPSGEVVPAAPAAHPVASLHHRSATPSRPAIVTPIPVREVRELALSAQPVARLRFDRRLAAAAAGAGTIEVLSAAALTPPARRMADLHPPVEHCPQEGRDVASVV